MSGLLPVARMARPRRVRRKSVRNTSASTTASSATSSLYCSCKNVAARARLAQVNTVSVLFMLSSEELPITAMLIEYSPVFTMMPERRLSMPIFVCKIAVTKPESIPASMAAGIDSQGCPASATTAPTVAPSVKQPSVDRSHTLSIE